MKNTTSNTASNTKLIVLFAMLLLSGFGMFGQTTQPVVAAPINMEVAASGDNVSTVEVNPNMNMVSWLMGTKQTPKSTISAGAPVGKNQMINSGIAPNRLLIKAFLKKANDFQSAIA